MFTQCSKKNNLTTQLTEQLQINYTAGYHTRDESAAQTQHCIKLPGRLTASWGAGQNRLLEILQQVVLELCRCYASVS